MELLWFLRPRFCVRYLHILLTFVAFSVFLVFFHQFRPKGAADYGAAVGGGGGGPASYSVDRNHFGGFLAGLRAGGGYFFRGPISAVVGGSDDGTRGNGGSTTGVLPIVYGQTAGGTGNKRQANKKRCTSTGGNDEIADLLQEIVPELPVGRARYDNRRLLKIYDFVRVGKEWERLMAQYDICLSTQSSLERIYWLPHIVHNWKGPLSLAVHVTSEEEYLILNLYSKFLDRCFPTFRDQVSMHLAIPASLGPFCFDQEKLNEWTNASASAFAAAAVGTWPRYNRWGITGGGAAAAAARSSNNNNVNGNGNLVTNGNSFNLEELLQSPENQECDKAREYMFYLLQAFPITQKEKLRFKEVYPQNHMRNIARKACGTEWTLSTDVDIIPRGGMAEMLQQFYESTMPCPKCAFVIPTFELDESQPFPKTKHDIVSAYNMGAARQFHGKIFDVGHKATNYLLWTSTNLEDSPVKVSHPIMLSQTYLYEPFYVSPDSIPPFDERFLGYGFTRNSQFQEALYAGWNFSVLTPVFSVHWGLQSPKTLLSPKKEGIGKNVRREQTSANSRLFNKILKEMKLKKQEGLF